MKQGSFETKGEWIAYITALKDAKKSIEDELQLTIERYENALMFTDFDEHGVQKR